MHAFRFSGPRILHMRAVRKSCHSGLTRFANPCTMPPIKLQSARLLSPLITTFPSLKSCLGNGTPAFRTKRTARLSRSKPQLGRGCGQPRPSEMGATR